MVRFSMICGVGLWLGLCSTPMALSQPSSRPRLMSAEDLWALNRVGPPSVSPDGQWCAVEVAHWDVPRDDVFSEIWLLATDGKKQKPLTSSGGKNSNPRWSPDGRWVAFIAKRAGDETPQIYLIDPTGGEATRLSSMPMVPSHLQWSADSRFLLCIAWSWPDVADDEGFRQREKQLKDSKVKATVTEEAVYRYWDRWVADGRMPMVYAVEVRTGKHRNLLAGVRLPNGKPAHLPPYEPSVSDFDLSPDGKELCFVAENVAAIGMDQNHDLFVIQTDDEAKTQEALNLTSDNPANDLSPAYSPDGKRLAFLRQRTKFFYADQTKLMVMDRSSKRFEELTGSLDRSCMRPRWLPDSQRIACEVEDAGYHKMAFIHIEPKQIMLPPANGSERSIDFAKDVRLAVYLRSSFNEPPRVMVHQPGHGEPQPIESFSRSIIDQWRLGKVESRTFKGSDDKDVQMFILYPPGFDASKKYPLLQMVHGGPHNAMCNDWSFRWNPQLWAAQGWVVAIVNFHGSSGFGQAFADSITGDYGTKPLTDIMKATEWFEQQPWIDKQRMAAAGASYGGYMMSYLNGHTDKFKAMVCHAGVYNYASQMASDLVIGRRRSLGGFPWEDFARSDKQSSNRFAQHFKTPTLVIHGEKDYRVPVTQGLEYYNTLKMKGVPARLVYFPDENHWILKPQNSLLWHKEVFGWLSKYIGNGPSL